MRPADGIDCRGLSPLFRDNHPSMKGNPENRRKIFTPFQALSPLFKPYHPYFNPYQPCRNFITPPARTFTSLFSPYKAYSMITPPATRPDALRADGCPAVMAGALCPDGCGQAFFLKRGLTRRASCVILRRVVMRKAPPAMG